MLNVIIYLERVINNKQHKMDVESTLEIKKHSKYFFIATFIAIIILSFILAWPFVTAIFGAIVLAYLFHPVYDFIVKIIKNETLGAFITSIIVIGVLLIPIIVIGNAIFKEASDLFIQVKSLDFEQIREKYSQTILGEKFSESAVIYDYLRDGLDKLGIAIVQRTGEFIFSLHEKILQLFVTFFLMFYLLKDGKRMLFSIKEALPLKRK